MKENYSIEITETLQRTVDVEADSYYDALDIVSEKYKNGEIVLNTENSCITARFEETVGSSIARQMKKIQIKE